MSAASGHLILRSNPTNTLLDASPAVLYALIQTLPQALVPWEYIDTLDADNKVVALRMCLLVWEASSHTEVPRENQLRSALSMYSRKSDVLVIAGTGSGKTLIMVMLLLMQRAPSICVTISPLKKLQESQVCVLLH